VNATAVLDQVQAASRDARSLIDQASTIGTYLHRTDNPGPVVRGVLDRIRKDTRSKRIRVCRHLAGRGPGVSWSFAWRPGKLFCMRCAVDVLRDVRGTVEDRTCDHCRRVVPHLTAGMTAAGPFVIIFGVCGSCLAAERAAAA
jgi:hypothetical protein